MNLQFRHDAVLQLESGPIRWEAYPTIDGRPITPMSVRVSDSHAEYVLPNGVIRVDLAPGQKSRAGDTGKPMSIRLTLTGFTRLPWRVGLSGVAHGATRAFVQGLGFSGPSGLISLTPSDKPISRESYLTTTLLAGDPDSSDTPAAAITLYATDHRRFLQQTHFHSTAYHRGLVNRHVESTQTVLEVSLLTENITATGAIILPEIWLRSGAQLGTLLTTAAQDIAAEMVPPQPKPPRWHYCSWYRRHSHYTLHDLQRWLEEHRASGLNLQSAQIDDGYQTAPGDWLSPNERWPGGLPVAFADIARAGLEPGIWVAPFMVGNRSQLFRDHPDWVVRTRDGKPWTEWRHYDGTHAQEEHYCLDASNPAVVEHLRHVFRQLYGWGARVFKTDFLDWGLKDSASAVRFNPNKTSVEAFRDVLTAIREEIGPKSYWLACIAPYPPMLGLADGVRIANDVGTHWSEGSHGNLLAESQHCNYFNRVLFENDPDAVYLREVFNQLSDREMCAIAYWTAVLGLSVNASEFPSEVPPSRMALWRWMRPPVEPYPMPLPPATLPWWPTRTDLLAAVRKYPTAGIAAVILNPTSEPRAAVIPTATWAESPNPSVFDWTESSATPLGPRTEITLTLQPHEARVLYLSPTHSPPPPGLTLGGYLPTNS